MNRLVDISAFDKTPIGELNFVLANHSGVFPKRAQKSRANGDQNPNDAGNAGSESGDNYALAHWIAPALPARKFQKEDDHKETWIKHAHKAVAPNGRDAKSHDVISRQGVADRSRQWRRSHRQNDCERSAALQSPLCASF
jgi:hypothetical protein